MKLNDTSKMKPSDPCTKAKDSTADESVVSSVDRNK